MKLIPIIICGGAGTRLWPVSRESFPKPLLKLPDGRSLLQKTVMRARSLAGVDEVLLVTNRETYFLVKDECFEAGIEGVTLGFVLEPEARNTAAAIAAACEVVRERHGEDTTVLILPADHLIEAELAFGDAVNAAVAAAADGQIVTFGIHPDAPETGFGYIECEGDTIALDGAVRRIARFVEKPKAEIAEQLIADGRHLWNAGIFCFSVQSMVAELESYVPEVLAASVSAVRKANLSTSDGCYVVELDAQQFKGATNVSIDYAVMERSSRISVVPCNIGWRDIGSWVAIGDLTPSDERGNRIDGAALLHDVDRCFIRNEGDRVIGAVGIEDLLIVDTPDALLVARKDRAQDVKQIVAALKRANHESYRLHRTVHRPWGTYTVLEEGDRFKMKRIVVKPNASLSLQMHHHRSEHWIVVSGCADVVNGEKMISLQPNESTYIPAGHKHRLINPGVMDLVLIEVQCGEYLGEDDIVRFDDVYGRVAAK